MDVKVEQALIAADVAVKEEEAVAAVCVVATIAAVAAVNNLCLLLLSSFNTANEKRHF